MILIAPPGTTGVPFFIEAETIHTSSFAEYLEVTDETNRIDTPLPPIDETIYIDFRNCVRGEILEYSMLVYLLYPP